MDPDRLNDLSAPELIDRLATSDPIPGGGSASAFAGAMGAALVRMVVELTCGRPDAAEDEKELPEIAIGAAACQSELLDLAELDADAYDGVVRARRLPRDTDEERAGAGGRSRRCDREATRAPLRIARRGSQALALAERLAPIGNPNAISDVGVAALLATTALRGAALNVRINLPSLPPTIRCGRSRPTKLGRFSVDLDDRERAVRERVEGQLG